MKRNPTDQTDRTPRFGWFHTLKGRLGLLMLLTAVLPIALIGYVSYNFIYVVQAEKINGDLQSRVDNERAAIDKSLDNMAVVSQLFAADGGLGQEEMNYLKEEDPVGKVQTYLQIQRSLSNISFSNPDLGAAFTYEPRQAGGKIYFPSVELKGETYEPLYPTLYVSKLLTFYGPHASWKKNDDSLVFSMSRTVWDYQGQSMSVYLETGFPQPLADQAAGEEPMFHRILGQDGRLLYGNLPTDAAGSGAGSADLSAYKAFESVSDKGWSLVMLMPLSSYEKVTTAWLKQFFAVAAVSVLFSVFIGWILAVTVYRPIRRMNEEISYFTYNQGAKPAYRSGLKEFQFLFDNFQRMRQRILELISDVETKEKLRGELEVEKLLVQINPHFLHNTLNTIQWLARLEGNTEIARLVTLFTRVLHYNLGKQSIIVTMREEVKALEDYIELQKIRYNFQFKIRIVVPEELGDIPLPRFLLQPLVENALYHGHQNDEGEIRVEMAAAAAGQCRITVNDNGKGIPPEKLARLLDGTESSNRSGLGIGLQYVLKMLRVYYGEAAGFNIESGAGKGTAITIVLPAELPGKGGLADEGIRRIDSPEHQGDHR